MVITRSKIKSRQTRDSPRHNPPGPVSASNQNIPQQPFQEGGVSSSTQDPGGCLTTSLAAGNERQPAVRKSRGDCLSCTDLSSSLEVKSNMTWWTYSSINIKSHEIHCKIMNYIYLLNWKNRGISGGEISISLYKNVCKGASFSIHILEKIEGDGFINGQ